MRNINMHVAKFWVSIANRWAMIIYSKFRYGRRYTIWFLSEIRRGQIWEEIWPEHQCNLFTKVWYNKLGMVWNSKFLTQWVSNIQHVKVGCSFSMFIWSEFCMRRASGRHASLYLVHAANCEITNHQRLSDYKSTMNFGMVLNPFLIVLR